MTLSETDGEQATLIYPDRCIIRVFPIIMFFFNPLIRTRVFVAIEAI